MIVLINAVIAQLVEHQLPKLRVTISSLAYRSNQIKEEPQLLLCCIWSRFRASLTIPYYSSRRKLAMAALHMALSASFSASIVAFSGMTAYHIPS